MGSEDKKRAKAQAKALKKRAKAEAKAAEAKAAAADSRTAGDQPSRAVRFAEGVRGVLFLILAVSMVVAVFLSNQGYIVKLEEIFESLVLATVGKVVLVVIAVAFFIYGLKYLRAIR
jgi:uncharacterized membrane protein YdbT with pleckstrin-like domain